MNSRPTGWITARSPPRTIVIGMSLHSPYSAQRRPEHGVPRPRRLVAVACSALLLGLPVTAIRAEAMQVRAALTHRQPVADGVEPGARVVSRRMAIREALRANPNVRISSEQVAQSRARVHQAVALPEPQLDLSLLGDRAELRPGRPTETDLALGITIPFPTKIVLQGRVARGELTGAVGDLELQRQLIVLQTNLAYDSLLVSLLHRRDLEEARTLAQRFLERTSARFEAGTVPRLDVIKARVDVAQAENDLIANEVSVAGARVALNRLLGRPLDAPIDAADTLVIPASLAPLDSLESLAMDRRPELRTVRGIRAGVDAAASLAHQYFIPDVGVSIGRTSIYGEPRGFTTSIGFELPLFPWQHERGEVAEAEHRQRELDATYLDVVAQVGEDLRAAYSSASTARRQAIYLRDELVPAASEAYRAVSASYELGGTSALEVLDAQRTLLDARTQYATALAAANDAIADLARATGVPADDFNREVP